MTWLYDCVITLVLLVYSPQAEMTNLELQTTLLTIAHYSSVHLHKKHWVIKELDFFSECSLDKLKVFIF